MPTEFVTATSDQVVRIETPDTGAVYAEGSMWMDYRDAVYAIAEVLGCKPLKEDILSRLATAADAAGGE